MKIRLVGRAKWLRIAKRSEFLSRLYECLAGQASGQRLGIGTDLACCWVLRIGDRALAALPRSRGSTDGAGECPQSNRWRRATAAIIGSASPIG